MMVTMTTVECARNLLATQTHHTCAVSIEIKRTLDFRDVRDVSHDLHIITRTWGLCDFFKFNSNVYSLTGYLNEECVSVSTKAFNHWCGLFLAVNVCMCVCVFARYKVMGNGRPKLLHWLLNCRGKYSELLFFYSFLIHIMFI